MQLLGLGVRPSSLCSLPSSDLNVGCIIESAAELLKDTQARVAPQTSRFRLSGGGVWTPVFLQSSLVPLMDSWGENHCLGHPVVGPCTLATPSFPACACQSCSSTHLVLGRCPRLHADPGSDGSPAPYHQAFPTSSHLWMSSCPLTSPWHSVAFYSFILLTRVTLKSPCFLFLFTYFSGFPVLQLSAQEQGLSCSGLLLQHLQR